MITKFFPKLPVLEKLITKASIFNLQLSDITIVSVQHLLETTGSLFESIISLGVQPNNIYLLGKIYSTHNETQSKLRNIGITSPNSTVPPEPGSYEGSQIGDIKHLWHQVMKMTKSKSKIIILDDGGFCIKNVPDNIKSHSQVIGIEQTTSGIKIMKNDFLGLPVIDVASSAAKRYIEPPIVSEAIFIKLNPLLKSIPSKKIAIIGFGNIGQALAKVLSEKGYSILIYDKDGSKNIQFNNTHFCSTLDEAFYQSDILIGVTGEDISKEDWLLKSNGNKTLISCSSGDIEFLTLLKKINLYNHDPINEPLQDITFHTPNGHEITLLRGGFVANFDGTKESSPAMTIQITRGLLFAAIIQAALLLNKNQILPGSIKLDSELQKIVVQAWFKDQPSKKLNYSLDIIKGFQNNKWIADHSS